MSHGCDKVGANIEKITLLQSPVKIMTDNYGKRGQVPPKQPPDPPPERKVGCDEFDTTPNHFCAALRSTRA
jgi:hypothetical protein